MDLHMLIESYLRSSQIAGKTSATLTWYNRRLGYFVTFLKSQKHSLLLKDLTLADGERYVLSLMQQTSKWMDHPNHRPVESKLSGFTIVGHVRAVRALRDGHRTATKLHGVVLRDGRRAERHTRRHRLFVAREPAARRLRFLHLGI